MEEVTKEACDHAYSTCGILESQYIYVVVIVVVAVAAASAVVMAFVLGVLCFKIFLVVYFAVEGCFQ